MVLAVKSDLVVRSERRTGQPVADGTASHELASAAVDFRRRIHTRHICRFARQMSALLRAGMPLVSALSALVDQLSESDGRKILRFGQENGALAAVVRKVRDSVNEGSTFAEALSRHPDVFPDLLVNMVAAGEASGNLEETLLQISQMLEKRLQLAGKIKSALAYPAMMVVVATGVTGFLLTFVVPSITEIFVETNRTLPWPTRMLISVSDIARTYFAVGAIGLCAAIVAIGVAYHNDRTKLLIDRVKLRLPLFGTLLLKVEIARLTRTLAALLAGGIPILAALEIAKRTVQNRFIANALEPIQDLVRRGQSVAAAMDKTAVFPPVVCHVIATGQLTGNIEQGLSDIADMYDNEVELAIKTLTSLLEPAILLVMGLVVGFIVMAVLLPIFEINQVL